MLNTSFRAREQADVINYGLRILSNKISTNLSPRPTILNELGCIWMQKTSGGKICREDTMCFSLKLPVEETEMLKLILS